jgi:hypothetical protein
MLKKGDEMDKVVAIFFLGLWCSFQCYKMKSFQVKTCNHIGHYSLGMFVEVTKN